MACNETFEVLHNVYMCKLLLLRWLATGWAFRGSNPGESDFFLTGQPALAAHPASNSMRTEFFPVVKRSGRVVDQQPHLATLLNKEENYNSTPPLDFRGLFYG